MDEEELVDKLMEMLTSADGEIGAIGSMMPAPDGANDWELEDVEREHKPIIEAAKGEDITPTIFVCRDDEVMMAEIPQHKQVMELLINQAADPKTDTDWAVFITTAYTKMMDKDEGEEELENYRDGDLSKDPESVEIQMMNMFRDGRQVAVMYDKETAEEMQRVDSADEGESFEGRMSFTDRGDE